MIRTASGTISDMQPLRRPAVAVAAPIVAATVAVAGAVLAAWARAGGTEGPLAAAAIRAHEGRAASLGSPDGDSRHR